ncbi:glucosamine-1-phosphate N-acetyltransferase; UDP-N-acetylglucosamine pyrophosphorylase [Syntrophobotulus glycolicus DSM 8271]|uniref:Bifunctional protein GlmU n=1 Tax=Syntrophobotulus glycolicus (strain DSM 8271 / FlGlyR) TaxID=645991 RepID=F0SW79_SYNGF|nr:bifunctional UDP-N-acetylglucosamine diphosphorylase/glucosamine-1-phosphate N-acetyltransferase GlmU [Syntrophobotulus glycolicus]ADY54565.1 glucosamine-1-phosphate N-acetyltransferase; UDP-N-acetylglucosamine pyrophosphorylase [Syntrophobotulus glycolicus DSM 8271]
MSDFAAVILAAGKGTRMKSDLPKVMHQIAGKTLIDHVLGRVGELGLVDVITVVGHGREIVEEHLKDRGRLVVQDKQLGTGHAIMQVLPLLSDQQEIIVLSGDQPLFKLETLQALLRTHITGNAAATVLSAVMDNPYGYGRILKKDGQFNGIVEEKDASEEQRALHEVNTGTYCFQVEALREALQTITPKNIQGEYYLTDVFAIMQQKGQVIETCCTVDQTESLGINNRIQLAQAEEIYYQRIKEYWMNEGVTMVNPASIFIDAEVELSQDILIHPFTILKGKTKIRKGSVIGPYTTIDSCVCGSECRIESSTAKGAVIGDKCVIGPYAYLRPGTVLDDMVKIGDFVEIKNSTIANGSKIPHLSYIGDSDIGENVNIGAGTITCNYDGFVKSRTEIGDGAFIGSNTNFVAPVKVGKETVIGAGSTITKDVPDKALALERSTQNIIINWRSAKDK